MGCSRCGARALPPRSGQRRFSQPVEQGDCSYTLELMEIWLNKLNCIREQNLYQEIGFTKYKINSARGMVESALNTQNPCLFAKYLDEVNGIILALINAGKCQ